MKDVNPIDEWKNNLPNEIEKNLNIIIDICNKINSFDLISYISFYNHLHNANEYSDDRGDKHFFVSETIACQCLKNKFISETTITKEETLKAFLEIQEATLKYCSLTDAHKMSNSDDRENLSNEIVSKIENESKHIRNPGHPKHHLIFSEKLLKPFENQIKSIFSFELQDSILIRDEIAKFLQHKYAINKENIEQQAKYYSKQTLKLKYNKINYDNLDIDVENIEEIINLSDSEIRKIYRIHFFNELVTNYSKVGCFTAFELAEFLNIKKENVENFLNRFSCNFESINVQDNIYQPISILKQKPIIKYDGKYVLPSIPLLIWVVEEEIEIEFKKNSKLYGKFITHKHEFLLNQAEIYFKNILPKAEFLKNIFYDIDDNKYEADGLLIFNDYLFIIEAKANRLSTKAKSGHKLKTDDHLNDIIKSSYNQGLRTLNYLKENKIACFQNKNREKINILLDNYREIILVSITLEQLGNIVPIIKTSDKLNYFDKKHFPWIISLYDLVVINDFFETPSLLISYIETRNKFLSYENTYIYEELDIIGYFLKQRGNTLSYMIEKERKEGTNYFYFVPETDFINNYYMYKFDMPNKYISKPSYFTNNDFKELICKIDKSNITRSIETSVRLMRYNQNSIKDLSQKYKKAIKMFQKDKELHDCSIFTKEQGGFGFTYMIANDENVLKDKLSMYIRYKKNQLFAGIWIGIGEINGVIKYIETA